MSFYNPSWFTGASVLLGSVTGMVALTWSIYTWRREYKEKEKFLKMQLADAEWQANEQDTPSQAVRSRTSATTKISIPVEVDAKITVGERFKSTEALAVTPPPAAQIAPKPTVAAAVTPPRSAHIAPRSTTATKAVTPPVAVPLPPSSTITAAVTPPVPAQIVPRIPATSVTSASNHHRTLASDNTDMPASNNSRASVSNNVATLASNNAVAPISITAGAPASSDTRRAVANNSSVTALNSLRMAAVDTTETSASEHPTRTAQSISAKPVASTSTVARTRQSLDITDDGSEHGLRDMGQLLPRVTRTHATGSEEFHTPESSFVSQRFGSRESDRGSVDHFQARNAPRIPFERFE